MFKEVEEEYVRLLGIETELMPMKDDFETKAEHTRLIETIANILQIKSFM